MDDKDLEKVIERAVLVMQQMRAEARDARLELVKLIGTRAAYLLAGGAGGLAVANIFHLWI